MNDLNEYQLTRLENGHFTDSFEGGNEFTVLAIARDILKYLSELPPGQYYVQIWTKEHFEWEMAGRLNQLIELSRNSLEGGDANPIS